MAGTNAGRWGNCMPAAGRALEQFSSKLVGIEWLCLSRLLPHLELEVSPLAFLLAPS